MTVKNYRDMCYECGKKQYTIRDEDSLMGITCGMWDCPECGKPNAMVIYAIDWEHAENQLKYPEKYD